MHTNDLSSFEDGNCDRRGCTVAPLLHRLLYQGTDELFPGHSTSTGYPRFVSIEKSASS